TQRGDERRPRASAEGLQRPGREVQAICLGRLRDRCVPRVHGATRPAGITPRSRNPPFIPAHSASKTRVNALMLGIQCIPKSREVWVPAFAGTNGGYSRRTSVPLL